MKVCKSKMQSMEADGSIYTKRTWRDCCGRAYGTTLRAFSRKDNISIDPDTLIKICAEKDPDNNLIRFLLNIDINIKLKDNDDNTALHVASEKGNLNAVCQIIATDNYSFLVSWKNKDGRTPLILAAMKGHTDIAQQLMEESRYFIRVQDHDGDTALIAATRNGSLGIVRELIAVDSDNEEHLQLKNSDDQTAIDVATKLNFVKIKTLLQVCENENSIELIEVCEINGDGTVHQARYLLKSGVNVDNVDIGGKTALMYAVEYHHDESRELAECLIDSGADIHIQDNYDETALFKATRINTPCMTELLINAGATLDIRNRRGETAICDAARAGNIEIVNMLLDAGADPSFVELSDGQTILEYTQNKYMIRSVMHNHRSRVKRAIDSGFAIKDVVDNKGKTLLELAQVRGDAELIEILKSAGAV